MLVSKERGRRGIIIIVDNRGDDALFPCAVVSQCNVVKAGKLNGGLR